MHCSFEQGDSNEDLLRGYALDYEECATCGHDEEDHPGYGQPCEACTVGDPCVEYKADALTPTQDEEAGDG